MGRGLQNILNEAKTEVVEPLDSVVPDPVRRTQFHHSLDPATTAAHELRIRCGIHNQKNCLSPKLLDQPVIDPTSDISTILTTVRNQDLAHGLPR
jgi:hypothetical protein